MTNATTTTRRAEITPAVAIDAAVCPPIRAVTPVPDVARGTTVCLSWRPSADVRASCGDVRGITVSTAAVRPGLYCGGLTYATSGWLASPARSAATGPVSADPGSATATTRGPLVPVPNP